MLSKCLPAYLNTHVSLPTNGWVCLFVGDGPLGDPLLDPGQLNDLLDQVGDLGVGGLPLVGQGEGAEVQAGREDDVGDGHLKKKKKLNRSFAYTGTPRNS